MAPSSGSAKQCDLILLRYQNSPIYAIYIEVGGIIIKLWNWEASDRLYLESSSDLYSVLIRLVIYNRKFFNLCFFITRKPEALKCDMVCLCPFIIWDRLRVCVLFCFVAPRLCERTSLCSRVARASLNSARRVCSSWDLSSVCTFTCGVLAARRS